MNPRTCHKKRLRGGGARGFEPSPLNFIPPRCPVGEMRERRVKPPQSLNMGVFNVRGCSTNKVKKSEIGIMFLRRMLNVCALSETKLKGRGEVMFGEVGGRVSGGIGKGWPFY